MRARRSDSTETTSAGAASSTTGEAGAGDATVAAARPDGSGEGARASERRWRTRGSTPGWPLTPWDLLLRAGEEMARLMENIQAPGSGLPTAGTAGTSPRQGEPAGAGAPGMAAAWAPRIELIQRPDALVVRAELPGLTRDQIDVSVADGLLTISGERQQVLQQEREGVIRTERAYGRFYRAIPLPEGAKEDAATASFRDGVLEVTVPVTGAARGRRIEIQE